MQLIRENPLHESAEIRRSLAHEVFRRAVARLLWPKESLRSIRHRIRRVEEEHSGEYSFKDIENNRIVGASENQRIALRNWDTVKCGADYCFDFRFGCAKFNRTREFFNSGTGDIFSYEAKSVLINLRAYGRRRRAEKQFLVTLQEIADSGADHFNHLCRSHGKRIKNRHRERCRDAVARAHDIRRTSIV